MTAPPNHLTIAEASRRIASNELSPVQLVQACLDRIDAIDGQLASTKCQGLSDGRVDVQIRVTLLALASQVAFRKLIDIERDHIEFGIVPLALPAVPAHEAVDDVLAVGIAPVLIPPTRPPLDE